MKRFLILGFSLAAIGQACADGVPLPPVAGPPPSEARVIERDYCCERPRYIPPPPVVYQPCCVSYAPPPPPVGWVPHSRYYEGQRRPHIRDWQGFQYPSPPPVEYRWR